MVLGFLLHIGLEVRVSHASGSWLGVSRLVDLGISPFCPKLMHQAHLEEGG